jgi:hypothetical protein
MRQLRAGGADCLIRRDEDDDEDQNAAADRDVQGFAAPGLRHAHGLEEASVAVRRTREDQPRGRWKIHRLGLTHSGFNLALKPGQKIVQAWRATGWWPDHYSIAIYDITKVRGGAKLKFSQIGIPSDRYSGHYRGWIETYWTPMKEIFATGTISERTKDRVKIDRERRIKTGRFRRSISKEA